MIHWSNNFFNDLYYRFDQLKTDNIINIKNFINHFCNQNEVICDLCCGYGRIAFKLANENYKYLTGIDKSSELLQIAKKTNKEQNTNINFMCKDVRFLEKGDFDLVFFFGTSFGYYNDRDNNRIIKSINNILKPGGLFLFQQVNNPQNLFIKEEDSKYTFKKQSFFHEDERIYEGEYSFHNKFNQKNISYKFNIHLYNKDELIDMFTNNGFNSIEYWGGFNFESFGKDSKDLIIKSLKL